jgi:AcrR family transcriptional regulator
VPKLWNDTIQTHRREVREAILDTTATLATEHGLLSVTMSRIAEQTGIGRATLYKYFPDVEAILIAWHHRHVTAHLQHLAEVRAQDADPGTRLEAVLRAYAHIVHARARHGAGLVALLHHDEHVATAQQQVHNLVRDVLAEAATAGHIRDDIAPDELAGYCLHALAAAGDLPDETAVHRLVTLTLAGLQPPPVTGISTRAPGP